MTLDRSGLRSFPIALDTGVVALVLLAAVMHASWNALVKAGGDRLVLLALAVNLLSPFCLVAIFFVPLPAAESWPYFLGSRLPPASFSQVPLGR